MGNPCGSRGVCVGSVAISGMCGTLPSQRHFAMNFLRYVSRSVVVYALGLSGVRRCHGKCIGRG